MFWKIKEKIVTVEIILDALITILHKKNVVTRDEIQREILNTAMGEHKHE